MMCLNSKDVFTNRAPGIGYKVFLYDALGKRFRSPMFPVARSYAIGELVRDDNNHRLIILGRSKSYTTGFHIFKTKRAALKFARGRWWDGWCVVKVRYSRVTATGAQYHNKVVVARSMKLLEVVT